MTANDVRMNPGAAPPLAGPRQKRNRRRLAPGEVHIGRLARRRDREHAANDPTYD
jgi:hypothetical protein